MSEFSVDIRQRKGVAVFDLRGHLDAHTAPELERAFEKKLKEQNYSFVLNFSGLSYISSAGLGVLMQFIEDIRNNDGDMKLSNMSPRVFNVFDLLGFPMLYEIFSDESEAIERFQNKTTPHP